MNYDNETKVAPQPIDLATGDSSRSAGLYVKSIRSDITTRLFAMRVDLEAILFRKKETLRQEVRSFMEEIEKKKTKLNFNATDVTTSVVEDHRVGGVYSFIIGIFGYERRVRRTRSTLSRQLNTRDVSAQIERFIVESQSSFEKRFGKIADVEETVISCIKLATDQLYPDEITVLKMAVRRALSRVALKPWYVKHVPTSPHLILHDPAEIAAASESAQTNLDRVYSALVSKANAARKKFEKDIDLVLERLSEELIAACLDRKEMEQLLKSALREKEATAEALMRNQFLADPSARVVIPVGPDEIRRALLAHPHSRT